MKAQILILLIVSLQISFLFADLPGCQTYRENQCVGNTIETSSEFENHRWFTPAKGEDGYKDSFQDYSRLVGHVNIKYSSDLKSAVVSVVALHKVESTVLNYVFDGVSQSSSSKSYDSSYTGVLKVSVQGADGSNLNLEEVDFVWNAPKINLAAGDYRNGQKGAIVEMFGWPHEEIEKECETISKLGYLGVKVYPAQEQIMSQQPFNNILNPWYFMYQPVSYKLQGRMGNREQLRSMIQTCRKYNVRVYADAVINHMTGSGNDANPHHRNQAGNTCVNFPAKNSSLENGPSPMYTQGYVYANSTVTGFPPSNEFPAVPYGPTDFHCERVLNSWTDPLDLNAGWLTGLVDLNTEKDNVQERIADYLTDLLSIGFSGFRVDAAKHIKPEDLTAIFTKLQRNMGGKLPEDFITWMEVLLGGEADLLMCDSSSTYNYGIGLQNLLLKAGMTQTDIDKIKVWNSGYPKEPEKGFCNIDRKRSAIQNDDSDQQTPGSSSRDMANTGCVLIINCDSFDTHRNFEIQLFENPNGAQDNANDFPIRLVLSSYFYPNDTALGIPDGKSDCSQCLIDCQNCQGVPFKQAYNAASTGYDGARGKVDYSRVHRDIKITNAMRKWIGLSSITHEDYVQQAEINDIGFLIRKE